MALAVLPASRHLTTQPNLAAGHRAERPEADPSADRLLADRQAPFQAADRRGVIDREAALPLLGSNLVHTRTVAR